LKNEFGDLDYFITELLSKARERLLLVAPYLSTIGMKRLRGPIASAAASGAWIRLVTGDLHDSSTWNYKSVNTLIAGMEGQIIRSRLRVLCAAPGSLGFIHAKLIIADHSRGYLGSANLSGGGLDKNFEVGVALAPDQAGALERLVDSFEAEGLISDVTGAVLPD
jgi:phosphatidylserine/phosphatidylglycerophosphate/cardiolipin synthase-like enzyme